MIARCENMARIAGTRRVKQSKFHERRNPAKRGDLRMLIVLDVGNTNITIGVFEAEKMSANFRITTKRARTSDEYGIELRELMKLRGLSLKQVDAVIIASVVPNIMHSLTNAIRKYCDLEPILVGPGIKTGIKLATVNPKSLGADRIVDAVASYEIYGGPVIVVDFGTATTYDLITENGTFVAEVTAPGIRTAANALWKDAAKLPEIEITKPGTILARDTITSMQAGLVYGYIGQTEYIIDCMKKESGLENIKVVATGGLGKMIADATDRIDYYDPMLTLEGLRILYEKNR